MQCPKCGSTRVYDNTTNIRCGDCGERWEPSNIIPYPELVKNPSLAYNKKSYTDSDFKKTRDIRWQGAVNNAVLLASKTGDLTTIAQNSDMIFDIMMNPPWDRKEEKIKKNESPLPFDNDYPDPTKPGNVDPFPPAQNLKDPIPSTFPGSPKDTRGFQEKLDAEELLNTIVENLHTHSQWEDALNKYMSESHHPNDKILFQQYFDMWQQEQVNAARTAGF